MSESQLNFSRQRQKGYVLVAGAVLLFIGGAAVFRYYDFPPIGYFGLLLPVGILLFFGYRNISAGRNRTALQDERSVELHRKAGLDSFWILLSIVCLNLVTSVFPEEGQSQIYLTGGMLAYALTFGYYRYVN
ncbi:hypothetical protein CP556_04005 [Natrinema sp. CBA1119]|uniref:hypothetical protein n=1 Tax=Natrinema sp. CBA1119 TaxID=1608465 RepID=UPI000BFA6C5F|nr:hypothetical protein [Natrinema sp. CBA1119]PGF15373.1 hypothetical protein CP556_04005 [Natrinema sp. CBA1119]